MNEDESIPTPDSVSEDQASAPAATPPTPEAQPVASTPGAQPEAAPTQETPPVILTPDAQNYLIQTGPWARFLSIMLFIGAGFLILAGASLVLIGLAGLDSSMGSMGSGSFPNGAIFLLGPIYVVMALLVYIVPGIFLFRYASSIKTMKSDPSSPALENALRHQKSFWKYLGIMAIIMLGIFVLTIMAVIFFAVIFSLRR